MQMVKAIPGQNLPILKSVYDLLECGNWPVCKQPALLTAGKLKEGLIDND